MDNGIREKNLYFYHPDHLGSSSYITDREGRITQHTEYIAFGEALFEEHSTNKTMPYLFNGKELDTETGLYYYGARYYDPRVSLWLNVDPLAEKTMTPYAYTNNNPIMLVDPDGRESTDWYQNKKTGDIEWKDTNKELKGYNHLGRKNTIGISHRSYTGKYTDRMYYLNANGSITEKTGDTKITLSHIENGKSIKTPIGTTITSSKTRVSGMAVKGTLSFTVGGGASLSFGYVKDSYGDSSFYYTVGGTLGIGAGLSLDFMPITTTDPNRLFRVSDFEGYGNSYEVGLGAISGSYGGTTIEKGLNASEQFNPNRWGKKGDGAYTTKGGSYGIGLDVGAVWSRSKTKLIGR